MTKPTSEYLLPDPGETANVLGKVCFGIDAGGTDADCPRRHLRNSIARTEGTEQGGIEHSAR